MFEISTAPWTHLELSQKCKVSVLQLFPLDNFQMEHPVKERNGKNVNDITTQQKKLL